MDRVFKKMDRGKNTKREGIGGRKRLIPCIKHLFLRFFKTICLTRSNTVDLVTLIYYNVKVHGNHVDVSVLCSEGGKENV